MCNRRKTVNLVTAGGTRRANQVYGMRFAGVLWQSADLTSVCLSRPRRKVYLPKKVSTEGVTDGFDVMKQNLNENPKNAL